MKTAEEHLGLQKDYTSTHIRIDTALKAMHQFATQAVQARDKEILRYCEILLSNKEKSKFKSLNSIRKLLNSPSTQEPTVTIREVEKIFTIEDLKDAFETAQKQAYPYLEQDGSPEVDHAESFDEWFLQSKKQQP